MSSSSSDANANANAGAFESSSSTSSCCHRPSSGPTLEALCVATLRACEAVSPAVEALYRSIGSESTRDNGSNSNSNSSGSGSGSSNSNNSKTTKTKADDSVFTIADGLVQHLLMESFLGGQDLHRQQHQQPLGVVVGDRVGEEDCPVHLATKPYAVDDLIVPPEFESIIDRAMEGVTSAREELLLQTVNANRDDNNSNDSNDNNGGVLHPSITAFVDPIDGTREFSTQKGEQCSICVGFADTKTGRPVAGVVYRPLSRPGPTWAAGAAGEGYASSSHTNVGDGGDGDGDDGDASVLLTTNGGISPFLESLMDELQCHRMPSAKGSTLYIQDRGVSRWDTCAAQAVLEAHGGILCRLDRFLEGENDDDDTDTDGSSVGAGGYSYSSYTYRKTDTNPDFEPGLARVTKYNAADAVALDRLGDTAGTPSEVKPYANLCGLVALGAADNTPERRAELRDALRRAADRSPPAYD
eukprot:jgi/Psemu1/297463/fgenesh1_pm.294_\